MIASTTATIRFPCMKTLESMFANMAVGTPVPGQRDHPEGEDAGSASLQVFRLRAAAGANQCRANTLGLPSLLNSIASYASFACPCSMPGEPWTISVHGIDGWLRHIPASSPRLRD